MNGQNTVSGAVLAGGQGRRMQHRDKGLLAFNNRPLISYALAAMAPLVDELMISANRNQGVYRQFGYPVVADASGDFAGPLAGILAAMQVARSPVLLIMPCDSPFIAGMHLRRLLTALSDDFDIAVAHDGERPHPVCAAIRTRLQGDLADYLRRGERKLQTWMQGHRLVEVDFSDAPEIFANVNTPETLATLQNTSGGKPR